MDQGRQGVHGFTIQQYIQFHEVGPTIANLKIVERGIAFCDTLQLVVEIKHDFSQWHLVVQLDPVSCQVVLLYQHASLAETKSHNLPDVVGGRDDLCFYIRLLDIVQHGGGRHIGGVVHFENFTFRGVGNVHNIGDRGDHVHVELPVQTFLYNFHMEHSEEPAAESKSKCG